MNVVLNVLVEELEKYINRQIIVDENITLMDLCEYIIVSMDGNKIPIYILEYCDILYYPYEIEESKYEKTLVNLTIKDLNLKKNQQFNIKYNFDNEYNFNIVITDILEAKNSFQDEYFKVISGIGYGILDNEYCFYLKSIFTNKRKKAEKYYSKSIKDYLQKTFDVDYNNNKIKAYIEHKKEVLKPKNYIFNISLEGFEKEIKRKICVNSDISIDSFCEKVIIAMNGDLSHCYGIRINKEYLSEHYKNLELFYLDLKEKQRLKIIYDWGDSWTFNLTLSKIIDGYKELDFEVLSGKGYGIVDDCGGIWRLSDIFNGNDTSWGKHDINDFNLEKCNESTKKIG